MYELRIARRAVRDLERLSSRFTRLVGQRIDGLAEEPRPRGAWKLRNSEEYRIRVGVYRVLYEVDDAKKEVRIHRVIHRREAYR